MDYMAWGLIRPNDCEPYKQAKQMFTATVQQGSISSLFHKIANIKYQQNCPVNNIEPPWLFIQKHDSNSLSQLLKHIVVFMKRSH